MRFDILTLFPKLILPHFEDSILKRAIQKGILQIHVHDIRKYSKDKHKKVDDKPYGGGVGMLMTCQPLFDAIISVKKKNKGPVIYLSPRGKKFKQIEAEKLSKLNEIILLCGHYEGIDQRVIDAMVDREISIGDFVLTGGELPALVLVDAISRLIPDVLGKDESIKEESFSKKLKRMIEYPHYTKPAEFEGMKVPSILLSGNHEKITNWRLQNTAHSHSKKF